MNVATSIATLASTRAREFLVDRFRSRRQRTVEGWKMKRWLCVRGSQKANHRARRQEYGSHHAMHIVHIVHIVHGVHRVRC